MAVANFGAGGGSAPVGVLLVIDDYWAINIAFY